MTPLKPPGAAAESAPMARLLVVAALLFLAPPADAAEVSVDEWHYLQQVGVLSAVNESVWKAFEEDGGWNRGIARYAQETTRHNARALEAWKAPVRELAPFHRGLLDLLGTMERFYGAIAAGDTSRAHALGARIRREMTEIEGSWAAIQHRYASPASP